MFIIVEDPTSTRGGLKISPALHLTFSWYETSNTPHAKEWTSWM